MLGFIQKRKAYADALEKEVSHHYLDVNGISIHYISYGKGPLLVLIHGWTNDWSGFIPLMKELSGFQILAVDLPGYGESTELKEEYTIEKIADVLAGLLKQLGTKADILCCVSMGTVIGVEFANKYPELLKKLILIGPPIIRYDWLPSKIYRDMVRLFDINAISRTLAKKVISNNLYGHVTAKYLNMYKYDRELIDAYGLRGRKKVKKNALFQMGKAMYNFHMKNEMLKLKTPTLVVFGKFDKLIDLSAGEVLQEVMKNVKVVWVTNAGHVVWFERPREAAHAIQEFAAE